MIKRIALDYLEDVYNSLHKCLEFTRGMDFSEFCQDEKTVFAVIRALEVAGEAAKNIPHELKSAYPDVPWKEMAGMRDVLIHQYFGIDHAVIWETIQRDVKQVLPILKDMIEKAGRMSSDD